VVRQPREGDPFQVDGSRQVLVIDVLEWGASRTTPNPARRDFYVARSQAGDRYVLLPLEEPVLDVHWRGIPLRTQLRA
jgi:hypothetical protein